MTKSRRALFGIIGLVAVLSALGVAGAVALDWGESTERAASVGERLSDAGDTPVLEINGRTVSEAEYAHEIGQAEFTLETMQADIAAGDVPSTQQDQLENWVDTIERVGVENVATGSIISQTALYDWALDQGYDASEQEIEEALAQQRQLQEDLEGTEEVSMQQAFIEEVGEERFWDEIMPRQLEREIVLSKAQRDVVAGSDGTAQDDSDWIDLQVELVDNAEVEILDSELTDEDSIEQGKRYILEDYPEVRIVDRG